MHSDTKNDLYFAGYLIHDFFAKFYKALGGYTSYFGNRVDDYLENNSFWEDRVIPVLDKCDDA